MVFVDWSDSREHKRLMVLRASVALQGRSFTLNEKAFPLLAHCPKSDNDQFLSDLSGIFPSSVTPLIISDVEFKVPWYKSVEEHGWYWLSRVRDKLQFAELVAKNLQPVSSLHSKAKSLGYQKLTKSNAINCQIAQYRALPKGRKNQRSTRTNCHHPSPKVYSDSAKELGIGN